MPCIDNQRAAEESYTHRRHAVALRLACIDHACHESRQDDKAFGSGNETERLPENIAVASWQMGGEHHHQHQAAQSIQHPTAGSFILHSINRGKVEWCLQNSILHAYDGKANVYRCHTGRKYVFSDEFI